VSDRRRAEALYRDFREAPVKRVRSIRVQLPRAVMVMGHCEFVGYATTHKGRTALYIHEFAPGSRPLLTAAPGESQLFLLAGRFRVTARGITDLDDNGRTVHARRRYKVSRRR
jgi:hypothetical protein